MAWMTIADGVQALDGKVSYGTVRRLAISGKVKATRIGAKILLDRAAFDEYIRNEGYRVIAPAVRREQARKRRAG